MLLKLLEKTKIKKQIVTVKNDYVDKDEIEKGVENIIFQPCFLGFYIKNLTLCKQLQEIPYYLLIFTTMLAYSFCCVNHAIAILGKGKQIISPLTNHL